MIKFSRAFLLFNITLQLLVGFSSPSHSMEEVSNDSQNPRQLVQYSVKETYEYYKRMHELAEQENFRAVIEMEETRPFEIGGQWTLSDLELVYFSRCDALAQYYNHLADKERANPEGVCRNLEKSISYIQLYLSEFENKESRVETCQVRMLTHRLSLYHYLGDRYSSMFSCIRDLNNPTAMTPIALKAIAAYEAAEKHCLSVVEIGQRLKMNIEKKKLNVIRFSLLSACCTLAQITPTRESEALLKRARSIRDGFKSTDRFFFQKANATLEVLRIQGKKEEKLKLARTKKFGPKTTKMLQETADKLNADSLSLVYEMDEQRDSIQTLPHRVSEMFQSLSKIDKIDPAVFVVNVSEGMKHIEEVIGKSLQLCTTDHDYLSTLYNYLSRHVGDVGLYTMLPSYCAGFGLHGDIDGAIARIEIVKKLQIAGNGSISRITRYFSARLRILRGEFEEWLALEDEFARLKTAAKNKKGDKNKAKVQAIKDDLAKRKEIEKAKAKEAMAMEKKSKFLKAPDGKGKSETDSSLEFVPCDTTIESLEERRLKKLERHEEAERRRAEEVKDAKLITENNNNAPRSPSSRVQEDVVLPNLLTLFHLPAGPRQVENEIVMGSWNITREELQTYFEALGCVYKPGKGGSHKKMTLPKTMHVEVDNEILMILLEPGEGGGALTLPNWDKGYVPDYLKPQILRARDTLILMKAKVQKAQQKDRGV